MGVADKIGQPLIYMWRHAEVAEDKDGTIRGTTNPELDPKGEKDSLDLAEWFRAIPLSAVYTDDLDRTFQTALPVAESKGLEVVRDPDLRSWDVGPELEGHSIEANKAAIARLKMQPWLVPTGGQSWGSYEVQIDGALDKYLGIALSMPYPIGLCVHGSGIQVLASRMGLKKKDARYDATPIKPAGVCCIYLTRDGLTMRILKGAKTSEDE